MDVVKYLFAHKRYLRFCPFAALLFMCVISYASSGKISIILSAFYLYGPSRIISIVYLVLLILASLTVIQDSVKEIKWLVMVAVLILGYFVFHIEYSMFLQIVLQRPEITALPFVKSFSFVNVFWSAFLLCICISIMALSGMEKRQIVLVNILLLLLASSSAYNSYWSWLGIHR